MSDLGDSPEARGGAFPVTDWSLVQAAANEGESTAALDRLCRKYERPIYATVRRCGVPPEDAVDLVQDCFVELLEKKWLDGADPAQGRFRTYLYVRVQGVVRNYQRTQGAQKRTGRGRDLSLDIENCEFELAALEPHLDPAQTLDRVWANRVIDLALTRLEAEQVSEADQRAFQAVQAFLVRGPEKGDYARIAQSLGITPPQVAVKVHKLKQRLNGFIRKEVADTLRDPKDVDPELRKLRL